MTIHPLTLTPLRSLRVSRPLTLRATRGRVWVTIEGDATDHVLAAGEALALPGHRHVIVEALDAGANCQLVQDDRL